MHSLPLFRFLFVCLGIFGVEPLVNAAQTSEPQDPPAIERASPVFSNESFDTHGETTEVAEDEDVGHPVFLGNREVIVNGSVGDLFAAGETVTIRGDVGDNAFVAAARVTLLGEVDGDLFVFAQTVLIEGRLGGDLYGAFEEVRVKPGATVEGDLHVGGARVIIEGRVEGRLVGAADEVRIDGYVGGDVLVAAGSIELSSGSEIGGDLEYDTHSEPVIPAGAHVRGEMRRVRYEERQHRSHEWNIEPIPPFVHALLGFGAFLLSLIVGGLCLGFGGAGALLPSQLLSDRPAMSFGVGFLVMILALIASFILFFLCITAPLVLVLVFALLIAIYLGTLITAQCVGHWLLARGGRQPHAFLCLLLGLVLYHVLGSVPVLGSLLNMGWSLAGLGALFLVFRGVRANS